MKKSPPRTRSKATCAPGPLPRTCGGLFLDSGAHSLYMEQVVRKGREDGYAFFKTKAFKSFVDRYACFVKKYHEGIDLYVTLDVIKNPAMSWKILKYLEAEHGLKPVPVIHYGTSLKWVDKHLNAGYTYLGVGGIGQDTPAATYTDWADGFFRHICPGPSRLPVAKTHGFAMTSHTLLTRYPWYSVDSVSWARAAAYGNLFVPNRRKGKFCFLEQPYLIAVAHDSIEVRRKRHVKWWSVDEQQVVHDWLEEIGVPLGSVNEQGECVEYGVTSQYNARARANLMFFDRMCDSFPKWPWPFTITPKPRLMV